MRTKLLSLAFAMLTVCAMQSQDTISADARPHRFLKPVRSNPATPICFPFWMVKAIALDLEEKQHLELEAQLYSQEVETYQQMLHSLEEKDQKRKEQLQLLEKNTSLLKEQLRAEQQSDKGARIWRWSLRLLAALGAGFILGRI